MVTHNILQKDELSEGSEESEVGSESSRCVRTRDCTPWLLTHHLNVTLVQKLSSRLLRLYLQTELGAVLSFPETASCSQV